MDRGAPTVNLRIPTQAPLPAEKEDERNSLPMFCYFPAEENVIAGPTLIEESDGRIVFSLTETAKDFENETIYEITDVYTVERNTLAVLKLEQPDAPAGRTIPRGFTAEYGGEKKGESLLSAWNNLRSVTLDIKTESTERTEVVRIPEGWGLTPFPDNGITVYADEALTEEIDRLAEDVPGDCTLYLRDGSAALSAQKERYGFTLEDVIRANHATVLTKKYAYVTGREVTENGWTEQSVFRFGNTLVQYTERDSLNWNSWGQVSSAEWTDLDSRDTARLTFTEAGGFLLKGSLPESTTYDPAPPETLRPYTDAEGVYYARNALLYHELIGGEAGEMEVTEETADTVTILVTIKNSWDPSSARYVCLLDRETLELKSMSYPDGTLIRTYVYGTEPSGFSAVVLSSMESARTLTYHVSIGGTTEDHVFAVPGWWEFAADTSRTQFYADAGRTAPAENLIPADGLDHEIWTAVPQW